MNSQTLSRPSATIYQFPVGGRPAFTTNRVAMTALELAAKPYQGVMSGSWYHEAAIRDEDKTYTA